MMIANRDAPTSIQLFDEDGIPVQYRLDIQASGPFFISSTA